MEGVLRFSEMKEIKKIILLPSLLVIVLITFSCSFYEKIAVVKNNDACYKIFDESISGNKYLNKTSKTVALIYYIRYDANWGSSQYIVEKEIVQDDSVSFYRSVTDTVNGCYFKELLICENISIQKDFIPISKLERALIQFAIFSLNKEQAIDNAFIYESIIGFVKIK